jgi:predicted metal-binding membrane protein
VQTSVDALPGIERLIRRDRIVTGIALAVLTLLSWLYLYRMTAGMHAAGVEADMHAAMGMTEMAVWGPGDVLALFVMWVVMMAGMMLPSAAPIILLVVGTYRRRGGRQARAATVAFAGGYLVAWTGFSALAALLQAALHAAALMSSTMVSQSTMLSAVIFLAAGAYQWMPLKHACLAHCQSPLHFLAQEWREGAMGGFVMGLRHGLFCVGCCWALMTLLFAAGVMNLIWVAAIAAFVLAEKLLPLGLPYGLMVSRAAGLALMTWGMYLLLRP